MQYIDINMVPGNAYPRVHTSQGDTGRQFSLNLYDEDGSLYTLDGTETLTIRGHKPDDTIFVYTLSSVTGSAVTITIEDQMTAVSGDVICELRIDKGTTSIGTANFVLDVEYGPTESGSISKSTIDVFDAYIKQAKEAAASAVTAAETATNAATEAAESATIAQNAISTVTQKASEAETSATNAANSASAAKTSETNAKNSESTIASLIEEATTAATNAKTSETNAKTSETNAATSATNAQTAEQKIENMTVEATTLAAGSDATVTKTETSSAFKLTFGIPEGIAGSQIWTTTTAPVSPNYTFTISNLVGQTGATPNVGDTIFYSYYKYTIASVSSATVFCSTRVSIRGSNGTTPTITVGTVTTGETASVTNRGTSTAAIFDFVIPEAVTDEHINSLIDAKIQAALEVAY